MRIRVIYFLEEALSSFRHNAVMSFAAIVVVLFSVLMVGIFMILGNTFQNVSTEVEKRVEIDVFLRDGAPQEQVYAIERKIKAFKEVESVDYVSKKEALAIFKKRFKNQEELISEIPGNPLPASYRVKLKDPHDVEKVAQRIEHFPERQTAMEKKGAIQYGKELVSRLFLIIRLLRIIIFALIIILILSSLGLISNTIRLAVYARRKEIAVMRLVGASNWFIRWPFLLEGILQGLAGAILAISVLASLKYALFGILEKELRFMASLEVNPYFYQNLLLMLLASGIVIGATGSLIALRRYLKI